MQVVQAETIDAYIESLRAQEDEAQNLFNDLLIGVTQFFRDPREFELLESQIVPKLFEGKARSDNIRVWVLGCSTGGEAYSIGILLRSHMAKLDAVPHVQIFATDIDGRALAAARVGRYTKAIAKDSTARFRFGADRTHAPLRACGANGAGLHGGWRPLRHRIAAQRADCRAAPRGGVG